MKKKRKRAADHLVSNLDLIYCFAAVLGIEMMFRGFLGFPVLAAEPFLYDLGLAGLICGLLFLMRRKTRTVFSTLILLFLGALALAQVLHYRYFTTFFSFSKASILQEFFTVKSEAGGKLSWDLIVFVIPGLLAPLFLLIRRRVRYSGLLRIGVFVLTTLFCVFNMLTTVSTYPDAELKTESEAYLYQSLYNKVRAAEQFGFYAYTLRDARQTLLPEPVSEIPPEELIAQYLEENAYQQPVNDYTGIFEGKNLILILCESLSPVVIREDLTPTLYRLSQEGINFTNHYAPVYQSATADSEFISLTSMVPSITSGPIAYDHTGNTFPLTLPKLLNAKGYTSNSFHSFEGSFYNRNILHESYGFEHLYDWNEFEFDKREQFIDAYNWMLDKDLMRQTVEKTMELESRPFFDFVITVSGHIPYDRYRYELESDLWYTTQVLGDFEENYSTEVISFYAAQRTLEQGLYTLIEQLELAGELENTVIALYGDHYPYGLTETAQKKVFGDLEEEYMIYKTPFIIWTPGMEGVQVDKVTSTYDILPTLANLFGLDLNGELIIGTDGLSDQPGLVIFEDSSWLTDQAYYDSTRREVTRIDESISDQKIRQINEQVIETLNIGQAILDMDYFAGDNSRAQTEE